MIRAQYRSFAQRAGERVQTPARTPGRLVHLNTDFGLPVHDDAHHTAKAAVRALVVGRRHASAAKHVFYAPISNMAPLR